MHPIKFRVDQMLNFRGLGEPMVDMDTLIEVASEGVGFAAGRSEFVPALLATLPSMLFLRSGRALRYSALALFLGAVTLIFLGIEGLAGAVVVAVANTLLVSVALLSTRKRLTQMEGQLQAAISAIHDLEVIEGRRQTFSARNPVEGMSTPASEAGGAEQSTSATYPDKCNADSHLV